MNIELSTIISASCPSFSDQVRSNETKVCKLILTSTFLVAADSLGFMSPTKGRETAYVDITYDISDKNDIRFKFFQDVEKILLGLDGRVSWSRLFLKDKSQVIQAYPEYYKFLDVKNELDPQNMFSNEFSDAVLFQKTPGKIASGGMNYEG